MRRPGSRLLRSGSRAVMRCCGLLSSSYKDNVNPPIPCPPSPPTTTPLGEFAAQPHPALSTLLLTLYSPVPAFYSFFFPLFFRQCPILILSDFLLAHLIHRSSTRPPSASHLLLVLDETNLQPPPCVSPPPSLLFALLCPSSLGPRLFSNPANSPTPTS